MAEAALFSLASKVLTTIISDSFKMAYEKTRSIKKARKELEELRKTVQTIQSILVDAEKQQQDSTAVKNWINRVRDALYDADDLFDEVIADDLLKQQRGMLKKVWSPFFKLKTNDSIAKKVKDIRKCLDSISKDMSPFNFVKLENEKQTIGMVRVVETGAYVNPDEVIGRDEDKKVILDYVEDKSSYAEQNISVIAIVGIGGMGKSTLAKLVYNDPKVSSSFRKRWWACINNISDEKEVTGRIFQSITRKPYNELSLHDLQRGIREYITNGGKFLLVLDDLWDENHATGRELRSLLSSDDSKGSMIIITTRSSSVAKAMDADKTHVLNGLSEDDSWKLFKSLAFTQEKENDPHWIDLGGKIVKKCANVPLAIKSIASLLYTKATLQEWRCFENAELSRTELNHGSVFSTLKLSYTHLPPNLKPCFAYCSLFPKNYKIDRDELICLWIAQGYVEPNNENQTVEEAGHGYFMELVRRFFIEKASEDRDDQIWGWRMHDLIHDLAQNVAGEESGILIEGSNRSGKETRHLTISSDTNSSWDIPPSFLNSSNRIRSLLFLSARSPSAILVVDQLLTKFMFLRALCLRFQQIKEVSCSIGELKHLRYLDLSGNKFTHLPDFMTKLVNLLTLNISWCSYLETLPREFRKLVNLRQLDVRYCYKLRYMPAGFEELTCLQNLPWFKVGKTMGAGENQSTVDALAGLKLKGRLKIMFNGDVDDNNGNECWQLPATISILKIKECPWKRIPQWWPRADLSSNLVKLGVDLSSTVKHLPPLARLPYLKILKLAGLTELEYIEEEEDENESAPAAASTKLVFFPCLENLKLYRMPGLKAWSRQVEAIAASIGKTAEVGDQILPLLPVLSALDISECEGLKCMPLLPRLHTLQLQHISEELVLQFLSPSFHSTTSTSYFEHLDIMSIRRCSLKSFPGISFTSLQFLELTLCKELEHLYLAPSQCNALVELRFQLCPRLELWDEEKSGVYWDSFPNLRWLTLNGYEKPMRLPDSLQCLQDQGILKISFELN